MEKLQGHWQLILITVAVFALWNTPLVFPLKILVIYLHELSHGLAAIFTGGSIEAISLSIQEGWARDHQRRQQVCDLNRRVFRVIGAWGVIAIDCIETHADRATLGVFGLIMLLVTLLYIRDPFPLLFCGITGALMIAAAWFLNRAINDFVLRVIGLTSVIYVPYDIFSDTIARSSLRSDAYMLAELVGGPTLFWGGLWLILSFAVIGFCIRYAIGENSNL